MENSPVGAFHIHIHGTATDITVGHELLMRLARVHRDLKALSAVRALDGDPFVHAMSFCFTVAPSSASATENPANCKKLPEPGRAGFYFPTYKYRKKCSVCHRLGARFATDPNPSDDTLAGA